MNSSNNLKIMNGLFPKEELAVERWIVLCNLAKDICKELKIPESDYYPNQHSSNLNEKTVGIALSNYRQGITKKGTTCQYDCVDYIITKNGFTKWLVFKTDEEKSLDKWKERITYAYTRCTELDIPIQLYYPCQRSECKEESDIAIAINNYQQALHKKGTHKIYQSVTTLLETEMNHWLTMTTPVKILLEKWRKKWELIRYICKQKNIAYSEFFRNSDPNHTIEKQILQSMRQYQKKQRYDEVDMFIRLFHPYF